MKALFADTSFYVAVLSPRDVRHGKPRDDRARYHGILKWGESALMFSRPSLPGG